MIGFDRPLRPQWIYESLLLAQPGQRLTELNQPFESIAKELTGKEGKRKARTVLFRCFIRDEENQAKVRSELPLKELSLEHGLDFMVPIYLFYLIAKTDTLMKISEHIFRLYDYGSEINLSFLKTKMVNAHGERDVVSRAVGAFIKTLVCFGIAKEKDAKLLLERPINISAVQLKIMLLLYAQEIIHSPQISLNHLPESLFSFFKLPNIKEVAQKFNGECWDYQHRMKDDYVIVR